MAFTWSVNHWGKGEVVALLVGHRTCDSQVVGSSTGCVTPYSGLGQATYTCVTLTKQYNLVFAKKQWCSLAGKVTADPAGSNGSLPLSLWLRSPVGWLPRDWDQLRAQHSLTLSLPIPLRLYTLPYWSNPPFFIFDIRVLWCSGLSARTPKCQKLKMVG